MLSLIPSGFVELFQALILGLIIFALYVSKVLGSDPNYADLISRKVYYSI